MIDLSGKRAIVTGARRGIGARIAVELARAGAHVAVCGRRAGDCAKIVAEVAAFGGQAVEQPLDVSDLANVGGRIGAAAAQLGGLDIVVNNAGTINPMGAIGELDPDTFDAALRVNVSGAAAVVMASWKHFKLGGRVINLLSGAAREAMPGWSAYCASKAALYMFTRSVSLEGEAEGILAFGFAPGLVDTDMQAAIRAAHINRVSDVPKESLLPSEAPARMVAWLASGRADDLAGELVDIRDDAVRQRMEGDM